MVPLEKAKRSPLMRVNTNNYQHYVRESESNVQEVEINSATHLS